MYEKVIAILEKSREKDMEVGFAADMVAADGAGHTKELQAASEVIDKYYDTITKLRREDDNESIKTLCDLIEAGDSHAIRAFVEEIAKR